MNKLFLLLLLLISLIFPVQSDTFDYVTAKNGYKYVIHAHNESSFQHAHCSSINGIEEFELPDKTRVDCLTEEYAIEYDFANKKYEAVGQVLHYAVMTGKKPKIVLILDNKYKEKQMYYVRRLQKIGKVYRFEVEYISEDILNECPYLDCKCKKIKSI